MTLHIYVLLLFTGSEFRREGAGLTDFLASEGADQRGVPFARSRQKTICDTTLEC